MEPLLNRRDASLFLCIDTPHYLIGFISYSLTLIPKSQNGESGLTYGFVDRLQNTPKNKNAVAPAHNSTGTTATTTAQILESLWIYGPARIVKLIRKRADHNSTA